MAASSSNTLQRSKTTRRCRARMENDDADDVGETQQDITEALPARMETDDADDASQHDRWMQRALDLADAAVRQGEVPVGAVFVVDGAEVRAARTRRTRPWTRRATPSSSPSTRRSRSGAPSTGATRRST